MLIYGLIDPTSVLGYLFFDSFQPWYRNMVGVHCDRHFPEDYGLTARDLDVYRKRQQKPERSLLNADLDRGKQ
jgi:hypothetical protein